MSVGAEPSSDHSIDPENVRRELVQYLTTAVNYVARQGLSPIEVRSAVEATLAQREADELRAKNKMAPLKPVLLDKGINDMRERMAN